VKIKIYFFERIQNSVETYNNQINGISKKKLCGVPMIKKLLVTQYEKLVAWIV
jgi:hypothetical protein